MKLVLILMLKHSFVFTYDNINIIMLTCIFHFILNFLFGYVYIDTKYISIDAFSQMAQHELCWLLKWLYLITLVKVLRTVKVIGLKPTTHCTCMQQIVTRL